MVEIIEAACGYLVRSGHYSESFQCKANALLAARILATAEAVMSQRDVGVFLPMGDGEVVCLEIVSAAA